MSDPSIRNFYAHTAKDSNGKTKPEKEWEPLFSPDCLALKGREYECELCKSLAPNHGHLNKVAWWTAKFASEMFPRNSKESKAAREWGYLAGLWHDLGKFAPEWQDYLRKAAKGEANRGPDHSTAGAIAIVNSKDWFRCKGHQFSLITALLGHHAGLANRQEKGEVGTIKPVMERLKHGSQKLKAALRKVEPDFETALFAQDFSEGDLLQPFVNLSTIDSELLPGTLSTLTRTLFSALVDADSIVTGALDSSEWLECGSVYQSIETLQQFLDEKLDDLCRENEGGNLISEHRSRILQLCRKASVNPRGFFSLNVPTGGGKTLSGMSFALNHARHNDLRRVVVVIPYTSIIRQNAQEYRDYLGDDQVLEHHSNLDDFKKVENGDEQSLRHRLGCENWEVPIVTTTTVQFYESLFSNKRTRSRKIHNIARSVIVLDEVQLIPVPYLRVIIRGLRALVNDFQCSVVLCTATQPALHYRKKFKDGIREQTPIIPDSYLAQLHADFQNRTTLDWSRCAPEVRYSNSEIAETISTQETKAALAIVHLKRDAKELYEELKNRTNPQDVFYLTTNLCPHHRMMRIRELTDRISAHRKAPENVSVYCASTQLVECGCDLDFPFVYRALAGLDSLAQAVGRCNRHGLHETGEVHFYRAESDPFDPHLARCLDVTEALLMHYGGEIDFNDPKVFETYFMKLYSGSDLDAKGLIVETAELNFDTIAKKFRIIETGFQIPVVIPYDEIARGRLGEIRNRLEFNRAISKTLLRSLQPYTINLFPQEAERLKDALLPLLPDSEACVLNWEVYPDAYSEEYGINAYEELGFGQTIL